jgi:hypothetical protein
MAQGGKRDERERFANSERKEQYESPRVEETPADAGLAVTAAGATRPPSYGAITLVDDDEEDE